jgi:hypothetical protein
MGEPGAERLLAELGEADSWPRRSAKSSPPGPLTKVCRKLGIDGRDQLAPALRLAG